MNSESYYHIYNRGINRGLIFFEEENYDFFLRQFKKYASVHVDVLAYCLMPNHFHFFIRVKKNESLNAQGVKLNPVQKAFKDLFISYSKSINKKYNRTGALFQYKFKRKEIANMGYYSWLIYYIHQNPIKAGLCKRFSEWKFSSYQALISDKSTILRRDEVLSWFTNRIGFIQFHESNLAELKQNYEFGFE